MFVVTVAYHLDERLTGLDAGMAADLQVTAIVRSGTRGPGCRRCMRGWLGGECGALEADGALRELHDEPWSARWDAAGCRDVARFAAIPAQCLDVLRRGV